MAISQVFATISFTVHLRQLLLAYCCSAVHRSGEMDSSSKGDDPSREINGIDSNFSSGNGDEYAAEIELEDEDQG